MNKQFIFSLLFFFSLQSSFVAYGMKNLLGDQENPLNEDNQDENDKNKQQQQLLQQLLLEQQQQQQPQKKDNNDQNNIPVQVDTKDLNKVIKNHQKSEPSLVM